MLRALLMSAAFLVGTPDISTAAPVSAPVTPEAAAARPHPEMDANKDVDAKKKAWFERAITEILEGRAATRGADR